MDRRGHTVPVDKRSVVLANYDLKLLSEYLSSKLQLSVVPDNITKPTADVMYSIFYNFLLKYLEVSEMSITSLPLAVNVDVDNEMHRKSIPTVICFVIMKAFIIDVWGDKLGLTICDMIQPHKNVQRIRKILSCLVDFMKFHETAHPIFVNVAEEFSERREELESLQMELGRVENKRDQLIAQQSARKRRELELSNELKTLLEELGGIVKGYETVNANKEEALKMKEQMIMNTQRMIVEIETCKKRLETLRSEILESPEQMKSEMENRKRQIKDIEEHLATTKQVLMKRRACLEICAKVEKQMDWMSEKCKLLAAEKNDVLEFMNEVMNDKQKMEDLENEFKFIMEKRLAAEERMREMAETHNKMKQDHIDRRNVLQKTVSDIERKMEEITKIQPKCTQEIKEKNDELLAIRNKTSDLKRESMQEIEELRSKFQIASNIYESEKKSGFERSVAVDRALSHVKNACEKPPVADYTFSTSEYYADENDENTADKSLRIFK